MKKFHKYYMSSPNLDLFNNRIQEGVDILPENATIESVNYQQVTTVLPTGPMQFAASVLIIYSTPLE